MEYQILISTVNGDDSIYEAMNIHSDAIIIDQTKHVSYNRIEKGNHIIDYYSFNERGVGLSRNSALMRSYADIIEFADDDMIFVDNHKELVLSEFSKHPEADVILFSVESLNPEKPLCRINRFGRVRRLEALKYGCARIAMRRDKAIYNNLSFSLLFGGGSAYGSGEDTLFLQDCLKAKLRLYKSPIKVANVKQEESSWFHGYTDRYFQDKGALMAALMPRMCYFYAIILTIKNCKTNKRRIMDLFSLYCKGIMEYKSHL